MLLLVVELTVRVIVAVCVKPPEVPVMVTREFPVVAVLLAASVSMLVLIVLGELNVAVTPLGTPEADRATLPVKPPDGATVIVLVPLAPCVTVRLLGIAESLKSGTDAAITVRLNVAMWVKLPEVPVMVTE